MPEGGVATSVKETANNAFIICGQYGDSTTGQLGGNFLIKLSNSGTTLWYKKFEFPMNFAFHDLTLDSLGNIYICATGPTAIGNTDINIVLIKTNPNGSILWTKSYGGTGVDISYSIDLTSDNNVILSGYTGSYSNITAGASSYTLKVDLNGNLLWNISYGDSSYSANYFVKEVYPNRYVTVGTTGQVASGSFNVFSGSGNILSSKSISFSSFLVLTSVTQYANGGYLISGSTAQSSGPSNLRPFLIAFDSDFNLLWAKKYYTPLSLVSEIYSIKKTNEGDYIAIFEPEGVNGMQKSSGLIKLNSAGQVLWAKLYEPGYYSYPNKLIITGDGGYMEVGFLQKPNAQVPIILKTDDMGYINGCVNDTIASLTSVNVTPVITSYGNISSGCIINNMALNNTNILKPDSFYCIDSSTAINIDKIETHHLPIAVFPNPAVSHVTFSFLEIKKGFLEIYDSLGELIWQTHFVDSSLTFNRQFLPKGIYFYKIVTEDLLQVSGKLFFE
ncbi:MAG TPA: T9SS type A sorting domain-containing protein [Bacteroidia bacterium]